MKFKLLFFLLIPLSLAAQQKSLQINARGIGVETNIYQNFNLNVQTSFAFGGGSSGFKIYNSLNIAPAYRINVGSKSYFDLGVGYGINSVISLNSDIYESQSYGKIFSFVDFSFAPFKNMPNLYFTTGLQYNYQPTSPFRTSYITPNFGIRVQFDKTARKRRKTARIQSKMN